MAPDSGVRDLKARLFGDDASDDLMKQMVKARLLDGLSNPTTGGTDPGDDATAPMLGELPSAPIYVGRFAVLRKLGHGGMGVVYAAYDEKLDRKIAVKVLRADLSRDEWGRARMSREAQALARLSHPNVVQVHEVGRWRDHDYVAMEFIHGETLDRWLAERDPSWQQVVDVVCQAGRGLWEAHRAGLIHRDFKPGNILVGHDGRARVLDFGLARTIEDTGSGDRHTPVADAVPTIEDSLETSGGSPMPSRSHPSLSSSSAFDRRLTVTGAIMGTPAYMAPEQHLGQPVTALSDQFAFCVVLYEALFGERPYHAETRAEYAIRVTEGDIVMPGIASGVPGWLRKAVVRGLSPKPEDRWPSMGVLLDELGRDRAKGRRRAVAATAVVAGVGVVLALPGLFASAQPDQCEGVGDSVEGVGWGPNERDAIESAFAGLEATDALPETLQAIDRYARSLADGRAGTCRAERVDRSIDEAVAEARGRCLDQRERELDAVVDVLGSADEQVVANSRSLLASLGSIALCERAESLDADLPAPRDDEAVASIAAIRADLARGHAARNVGRIRQAEAIVNDAQARAQALGYRPLLGEVALLRGDIAMRSLDAPTARDHYHHVVAVAMETGHHRLASKGWANLALLDAEQSGGGPAPLSLGLADVAVARGGEVTVHRAAVEAAKAWHAFAGDGDLGQARVHADRAVELAERELPANTVDLGVWLALRSRIAAQTGDLRGARADLERVLDLEPVPRSKYARPDVLNANFDLGVMAYESGELAEAAIYFRTACDGYRHSFGPSYPALAHCELARAAVLLDSGDPERAVAIANDVLDSMPADHDDRGWALDALAGAQSGAGDVDGAVASLRAALAHEHGRRATSPARVAYLRARLAEAQRRAGALDSAELGFRTALAEFEALDQGDAPDALRARLGLARVLLGRRQFSAALAPLERALLHLPVDGESPELAAEVRIELAFALESLGADGDRRRRLASEAKALLDEHGPQTKNESRETMRKRADELADM